MEIPQYLTEKEFTLIQSAVVRIMGRGELEDAQALLAAAANLQKTREQAWSDFCITCEKLDLEPPNSHRLR